MYVYGKTMSRSEAAGNNSGEVNQDTVAFGNFCGTEGVYACVFDGLAGHPGSEHASRLAADTTKEYFENRIYSDFNSLNPAYDVLMQARTNLIKERKNGSFPQMTCAAASLVVLDNKAFYAWTGDCRVYIFEDNHLKRLSEDHDFLYKANVEPFFAKFYRTVVANAHTRSEAYKKGGSLAKKAFNKNNLMYSDLSDGEISFAEMEVSNEVVYLLTSDGVHDNLTQTQMEENLVQSNIDNKVNDLLEATTNLIRNPELSKRSHPDDISAVIVVPV